ncbi:transglycosylase SLT domain-containing protein, partial [Acinetobacter baumannii]|nr:transglycosylase SLT domain-containing protein [Acinetobacter baumannii]
QAKVAEKADEELKKLTGNDKAKAVNDLTTAFNAQNKALEKSSRAVGSALIDIENYARGNREVEKISQEARTGTISYTEAIERLNKIKLPTDLYENLKKQAAQYDDNASKASLSAEKLKLLRVEVKLGGNEAQNAAIQHQKQADALGNTATEAEKATKALQDYQAKQKDSVIDSIYKSGWLDKGYTVAQANAILELQKAKGMSAILSKDEIDSALRNLKIIEEQQEREDKLTEAKRKQTKESEKKLKITQAELEVAKRSAALIESSGLGKYAESKGIPSSVIAGLLAQESKGIREAKSHTGAIGYFQTTSGYRKQNNMSVADSYDLEKSGKIVIDNIAKVYEKTGDLAQAILSHNAGEGGARQFTKTGKVKGSAERNKEVSQYVAKVSRYSDIIAGGVGKGGLSDGDSDRAYGKQIKARLELVKQGLNLQEQYEEEQAKRTKARNEEINLAQQTGQTALIPKINERYDAEDKLAQKQFDFEVNGYKWTEEQKLDYTYETNSLRLVTEGKLTEEQRKIAIDSFKLQQQQELGLLKLAQEQRLFQAKQALLTETQAMQERYRLEREEILKNTKLSIEERQKLIALSKANQDKETRDKVNNAVQNWGGIQASITGNSGQFALEQERFRRYDASQKVFDSQLADIETQEQDPNANMVALNAQREQIMKEHFERLKLIESTYQNDSMNLQLGYGASVTGALAGMFKNMLGESSSAYHVLYESQRAFALAQAGMNMWKAASDAYANEPGTWYQKAAAAAIATIKSGTFVSLIQAATPQGFADGGYTGNGLKHTPAGIVHKGEVVWSQEDIKRWGGVSVVESMRQSNPSGYANGGYVSNNQSDAIAIRRESRQFEAINSNQSQLNTNEKPINVYVTVNADGTSKTETENDSKQLGQMIGNAVRTIIRQEQRQGGLLSK